MAKQLLQEVRPYVKLYRDTKNGLAWIEDGTTGMGASCHSNIDETGSVRGMKALGHWGKNDRTVRSHGWIYNIDTLVVHDDLDEIVRQHCQCEGEHRRRS